MKVLYGVKNAYVDVTYRAFLYNFLFNKKNRTQLHLPELDTERTNIFNDHLEGIIKHIVIVDKDNTEHTFYNSQKIEFNVCKEDMVRLTEIALNTISVDDKLTMIHKNVKFMHGNIIEELPQQVMTTTFIKPENVVLELSSNIGRNTVVISCLLNEHDQLVTLENAKNTCKQLKNNKDINELEFNIENSGLSTRMLIQKENSRDTEIRDLSDSVPTGYNKVNTITFSELKQKYNKVFDTIVADCEGSLYYIFQDFPDILEKDITTIIMENDYHNPDHKISVNQFLEKNGFTCVYRKMGGWGPCYNCFFETWKKVKV
jgi:FkbM family methyltransferase